MNLIKNRVKPNYLSLVWKNNDTRELLIIGRITREANGARLDYLINTDDFRKAQKNGFTCFPAFPDINKSYTINVLEVFSRRIPPRNRGDYDEFLQGIGLPISVKDTILDFDLLGYSEVRLPCDGFAIINSYDEIDSNCDFLTEVAGFRYQPEALNLLNNNKITKGLKVDIQIEDGNEYDINAVKVVFEGEKIGYINRAQNKAFRRWIQNKRNISAQIEKINGTQDRPSVILFVEIR
jgi:hypothetical protein